jgi:hypothetical protein
VEACVIWILNPVGERPRQRQRQRRTAFFFFFLEPPTEFEFNLETNQGIPAERAIAVTAALLRAIRSLPAFPHDGQIEIAELGRGSLRTKLLLYSAVAGAFAGVGSFAKDIADVLKEPGSELARCVAWTVVEDGVTKAGIRCEGDYEVLREQMPAVARLEAIRVDGAERAARADDTLQTLDPDFQTALDSAELEESVERSVVAEELPDHSTFTNVPAEPNVVELQGRFARTRHGLFFVQPNGEVGLLGALPGNEDPPLDLPVVARLTAVRGPRGGWADRRLRVLGWTMDDQDSPNHERQPAPDIWRRGGDDEEFDLLPGPQSGDLKSIADPGHDLHEERSFIEQQPLGAFVGQLAFENDDVVLVTDDGDTFLVVGDLDYPSRETHLAFAVIGRAGLEVDDRGRRRLLAVEIYPVDPG